jgi:beta-glucanase (GH16 family)
MARLFPRIFSALTGSRRVCFCLGGLGISLSLACGADVPSASVSRSTEDAPAPPGIRAEEASRWRLIWRDEFAGTALDPAKWSPRSSGPRESSIVSPDCVTLNGHGLLQLWVKDRGGVLQNAMIGTQRKFEARFGIMAARIRFPGPQGQHGSFWMQPARGEKVPNDAARSGAEVDIIEWFGAGRKDGGTASNVYWPSTEPKPNRAGRMVELHQLLPPGQTWSDDFHVYSVEWSPRGYLFRVDDHETQRIAQGISQQPQYLILSLLTSDWEAGQLDHSKLPNSMDVDWVRVWQTDTPEREAIEGNTASEKSPASFSAPSVTSQLVPAPVR